MNIKPIKNQEDYNTTLSQLDIPIKSLFLDYKTSCT